MLGQQPCLPSSLKRLFQTSLILVAVPSVQAQTITAAPAISPASIPVDHPVALLLLVLAMAACVPWMLRKGLISARGLRTVGAGLVAVSVGVMVLWGDNVRAQLQELQQAFTQPGGQTLSIPVQTTGTMPSGSPLGFLPVVHTNQTASGLRIASITLPAWNTCFPLGVPSPFPVTPARPGAQCAMGTTLAPGNACWVDVAKLCADAAVAVQGSHPSQLQADTNSVSAGSQVSGNVLTNDSDADGPLTVASFRFLGVTYAAGATASVPGVGSFSLQSTGAYSFTASSPFTGVSPAVWTYVVQTGSSSTLSVTVSPLVANSSPVTIDDTASVLRNNSVNVAVRTNDTDADGDILSVTGVTQGVNGSVVIDVVTNNPVYTPNPGFVGTDLFTYTISDGNGGTATGSVSVTVIGNRPPVAVADSVTTGVDTLRVIPAATLLANDNDPDGDTLSIVSVQAATQGTVSLAGGNVTFTPAAGYEGSASFAYTIQDPEGESSTATVSVTVGAAQAPSVVVQKALVVAAHGTGGVSTRFPITTALVDTDGSESLTAKVSNVPTGISFNAGVNQGGGVWQFTEAELPNLMISLPGSYSTNATNLTVQVISTEVNGGATASVSSVVTLRAYYTTVDITTTSSGSYTGNSASEYVQGGSGNNTIDAGSGNNIVLGGAGNDNLSAGAGSDMLYGEEGDDTLDGGSGADVLVGGPGNDTMQGGDAGENFVDVFVWNLGDQGAPGTPAIDTILNFATAAAGNSTAGGDVLNLSHLLQGERVGPSNGAGNLADYLHFEISGGNTLIHISHTGGFAGDSHTVGAAYNSAAETQRIVLVGVDLQSVYSGATTDAQIITQLLNNNKLIVD
jgi:hypothetical protein